MGMLYIPVGILIVIDTVRLSRRLSHVGPVLRRCVQVDRRGAAVQHHLPQSAVRARRAVLHRVERVGPRLRLLQQEAIPLLV